MTDLTPELRAAIYKAIQDTLDDDEILMKYAIVAEVSYVHEEHGEGRFIQHRAGTIDPHNQPYVWDVMGMLRAGEAVAERQLLEQTFPAPPADDEDEE